MGSLQQEDEPIPRTEEENTQMSDSTLVPDNATIKKEPLEEPYSSNSPPRDGTQSDTTDDSRMDGESQVTTGFNYRPPRAPTISTEDAELAAHQSALNLTERRSQAGTLINRPAKSTPRRPTAETRINIANVAAFQRAMIEKKLKSGNPITVTSKPSRPQTGSKNLAEDAEEDNTWMNGTPEPDDEYNELIDEIDTLKRRENNGKITAAEIIRLMKLKSQLLLKNRLKQAAANTNDPEDEESLFVPMETREEAAERHSKSVPRDRSPVENGELDEPSTDRPSEHEAQDRTLKNLLQDALFNSEPGPSLEKTATAPKKPRRKPAKDAREVHERARQDRVNKERQKAQRKKSQKPAKSPRKKAAAKSTKATKKAKSGGKANADMESFFVSNSTRRDRVDTIAERFLNDLRFSDQVADRMNDPIFNTSPEEIILGRQRKNAQFKNLLANIPDGSNMANVKNDKANLVKASKSFGFAKVHVMDGKWNVKGMKSLLYHHQLLGAHWMLGRELGSQAPFGGILADGMGLGKTVQMLACMVGNPPQENDLRQKRKATLIVVPSSVISQWMREIRTHAEEFMFPKILHYRGSSNIPKAVLEDLDIVITSYGVVMRQMPFPNQESRDDIADVGYENWFNAAKDKLGELHKVDWYRVVLDECHTIKNHIGQTSIACQNLKSLYKWCLTGTPLLNRVEE